jgi:DNA-directed RNA polymerase specialized sigma24 family protein
MRRRAPLDGQGTVSSGFTCLLARLDSDPDRAAAEYQRLRITLEKFFDWNCAWPPEECADETLDRLVLKLASGIEIDDARAYARGIARLVLLEWRRRPVELSLAEGRDHPHLPAAPSSNDSQSEALTACFDRCLSALPAESRTLLLDYYAAEGRAKIDNRRNLARTLGISESALRNRVQRIRDRLERCVRTCTGSANGIETIEKQPAALSESREK